MADTTTAQLNISLGVGSIIGESFRLTFRNFFPLLGVMILPFIAIVLAGVLILGATFLDSIGDPLAFQEAMATDPSGFWALYALFMLVAVFFGSFMYAALIKAIFDAKSTGRVQIGAAMRTGMARCVPLFAVIVVYMILFSLAVGIGGGVIGAVFAFIGLPTVAVVLGTAFIMFLAFYILGATLPVAVVSVVENRLLSSIGRTFGLTKGFRWPIVGALVLLTLIVMLIGMANFAAMALTSLMGIAGTVIGMLISLLVNVIIYGASFAMVILVYTRLREIKEGASADNLAEIFS